MICVKKDDKYVFKDRNSCSVGELLALVYMFFIFFFETNLMIIYNCTSKIF